MRQTLHLAAATIALASVGCAPPSSSAELDSYGTSEEHATAGIAEGSREAAAVLHVANQLDFALLTAPMPGGPALSDRAADNLVLYREGDDEVVPSADDETFGTLAELDAVPRIGPDQFTALLRYARERGLVAAPTEPAGSGQLVWGTDLGGDLYASRVSAVAGDSRGYVVIAGEFRDTMVAGLGAVPLTSAGSQDVFVATLDAEGAPLWSRSFGTAKKEHLTAMYVDAADEILLHVATFGDQGVFDAGCGPHDFADSEEVLVKLAADGSCRWSRSLHVARPEVALAADGRIAIVGQTRQQPFGSVPQNENGIVLLDRDGEVATARVIEHIAWGASLAFAPDGDLVLYGRGKAQDFGGGLLGEEGGTWRHMLVRLDASLDHVWSRSVDVRHETTHALDVDDDGSVVLVAGFEAAINLGGATLTVSKDQLGSPRRALFALRLTADGEHLWSTALGYTVTDSYSFDTPAVTALHLGEEGAYVLGGITSDAGFVRLDGTGRIAMKMRVGSGMALGGDSAGHVLVGGERGGEHPGITRSGGFVKVLTP